LKLTKKQKSHALKQARKWVAFKIKMEKSFKRELKSYFYQQSKNIRSGNMVDSISGYLEIQYKRIIRNMTGIKIKQEDDDYGLEQKLLLLLTGRAIGQSLYIDKTTKKLLSRAIEVARQELSNDGVVFPSQSTLDSVTANIFKTLNKSRPGLISVTETQMLVEKVKTIITKTAEDMINDAIANENIILAEEAAALADSLAMEEIAENIGKIPAGELFIAIRIIWKIWVTMGDKRVRPWHQKANYQTVPESEPFEVKGELLMYPGDTSLGASMENVSSCRCSSVNM